MVAAIQIQNGRAPVKYLWRCQVDAHGLSTATATATATVSPPLRKGICTAMESPLRAAQDEAAALARRYGVDVRRAVLEAQDRPNSRLVYLATVLFYESARVRVPAEVRARAERYARELASATDLSYAERSYAFRAVQALARQAVPRGGTRRSPSPRARSPVRFALPEEPQARTRTRSPRQRRPLSPTRRPPPLPLPRRPRSPTRRPPPLPLPRRPRSRSRSRSPART